MHAAQCCTTRASKGPALQALAAVQPPLLPGSPSRSALTCGWATGDKRVVSSLVAPDLVLAASGRGSGARQADKCSIRTTTCWATWPGERGQGVAVIVLALDRAGGSWPGPGRYIHGVGRTCCWATWLGEVGREGEGAAHLASGPSASLGDGTSGARQAGANLLLGDLVRGEGGGVAVVVLALYRVLALVQAALVALVEALRPGAHVVPGVGRELEAARDGCIVRVARPNLALQVPGVRASPAGSGTAPRPWQQQHAHRCSTALPRLWAGAGCSRHSWTPRQGSCRPGLHKWPQSRVRSEGPAGQPRPLQHPLRHAVACRS